MKILIIGGTRFFGKRFVDRMISNGHEVTILTRGNSPDEFGSRIHRLRADRTDPVQLKSVIKEDYDVVVDNMLMTGAEADNIIALLKDKIGHYVMTSTLSVYDPKPGALAETAFKAEDYQPITASGFGGAYQKGKREAEQALLKAPFSTSVMRIPVIVGPDDYTERLLTHVRAVKDGKRLYFPNPEARFSFLHSQDAARALEWFCEIKPEGTYNISAPDAWSLRNLMELIEKIVGRKFEFGNENDPPSPYGIPDDFFPDTSKASAAGFEVSSLQEWMPDLILKLSSV